MNCRKCGSPIPDGASRCTVCGAPRRGRPSPGVIAAIAAWILLIGGIIGIFGLYKVFFSDEDLIEKRFAALETACNGEDLEGALRCFDLKTRMVSQGLLDRTDDLLTEHTHLDLERLLGLAGLFVDRGSFRIQVLDIRVNGRRATARIALSVETYGFSHSCRVSVPMMKEGMDWYVGGVIDDLLKLLPKKT